MFKLRRKQKHNFIVPSQFIELARERAGEMLITQRFIAVYHSGTDKVLIIPTNHINTTNEEAEELLLKYLEHYNAKIK